MNKQPYRLHRHEIIKLILKEMDYTMVNFSKDAGVSISTIFNWMRKPETCAAELQIETAFLKRIERTKALPVKKAKAILRNSELTLNLRQSDFIRVIMDRYKVTVNQLSAESGIDRNQVFFWTQGKKDGTDDDQTLKLFLSKCLEKRGETLSL
jgi:lambda repressor-like predicted transcriptional regulator